MAPATSAELVQSGGQQVIELRLEEDEQQKFAHSVEVIKANIPRLP